MIGPGWLPGRPRTPRKHTLAYMRMRRRSRSRVKNSSRFAGPVNTEIVLFDHGPAEFPVATAVPREPRARAIALVAAFQRWALARWDWLRPRTVPCAVAALGMIAVIASVNYLAHQHDHIASAPVIVHVSLSAP